MSVLSCIKIEAMPTDQFAVTSIMPDAPDRCALECHRLKSIHHFVRFLIYFLCSTTRNDEMVLHLEA